MADATVSAGAVPRPRPRSRSGLRRMAQRKSTIAFLMALPLILLIVLLVALSGGLLDLPVDAEQVDGALRRLRQLHVPVQARDLLDGGPAVRASSRVTAVIFKALIGFVVAHFVHNIPAKGQRKWRGMLLVPWVIPPAMSTLAWLWLFDPSYSAFNWILAQFGIGPVPWTGDPVLGALLGDPGERLDRRAVLHDHVPGGAEVGARAALRGRGDRRRQLVAADLVRHAADDAQHHRDHGAVLADRHLRQLRHRAHPDHRRPDRPDARVRDLGVQRRHRGDDIPLGAAVSLFMLPILAVAASFILRDINRRAGEMS